VAPNAFLEYITARHTIEKLRVGPHVSLSNARLLVGKPYQYNPDFLTPCM
jgi:hypothetical protein